MDDYRDRIIRSIRKNAIQKEQKTKRQLVGRTSKLPVYQWLSHIFRLNEELEEKLTDEIIVSSMSGEFSRKLALVRSIVANPGKLASERSRFNNEENFPLISLKYNDKGFPVTGKSLKAMSLSECRKKCYHYKKIDPRFFSQEELVWIDEQLEEANEWYLACQIPSQEIRDKHSFGSVLFGIPDDTPIDISMLELEWMK